MGEVIGEPVTSAGEWGAGEARVLMAEIRNKRWQGTDKLQSEDIGLEGSGGGDGKVMLDQFEGHSYLAEWCLDERKKMWGKKEG